MVQIRRWLILLFAGAYFAMPLATLAQTTARIAVLSNFSQAGGKRLVECFRSGLGELGWVEGRNLQVEYRWSEGIADRFPAMAADLVKLRPNVIIAISTPGVLAAQRATRTVPIPVVMIGVSDPVASGVVATLARPGGNITGVSNFLPATSGKLLELIKSASPGALRVGVLYNGGNKGKILEVQELRASAQAVGMAIMALQVRSSEDFDRIFASFTKSSFDALVTLQEGLTFANRSRIVQFATEHQLPSAFQIREFVEAGGLLSYGLNYCHHFRGAAPYVDKILKGAKPGELSVELPTTFELMINLKAASAIGLKLPQGLLVRADEIIQ